MPAITGLVSLGGREGDGAARSEIVHLGFLVVDEADERADDYCYLVPVDPAVVQRGELVG